MVPRNVCTTPPQPVPLSSETPGMSPAALPGPFKPLLRGVLHEHSVVAALAAGTMLVLSASTPLVRGEHLVPRQSVEVALANWLYALANKRSNELN